MKTVTPIRELLASAHRVIECQVWPIGVVPLWQSDHKHIPHGLIGRYVGVIGGTGARQGHTVQTVSQYVGGSYSKSKLKACICSLVNIKEDYQSFLSNRAFHLALHGGDVVGAPAHDENWNKRVGLSTGRRKIPEFLALFIQTTLDLSDNISSISTRGI